MSALEQKREELRQKMREARTSKEAADYKRLFRHVRNQIETRRKNNGNE